MTHVALMGGADSQLLVAARQKLAVCLIRLLMPLQAPEDNWHAYLTACMDAVRAKYFPRVACGAGEAPQSSRSAKGSDLQGGKVIYAQAAAMLQREDTAHIPDTYQQDSIQA